MNVGESKDFFFIGLFSFLDALNCSSTFFEAFGESGVKIVSDGLFFGIELMVESLGGGIESLNDILSELGEEVVKIALRVERKEVFIEVIAVSVGEEPHGVGSAYAHEL
jgi:hypothetical protein